ncbi:MAG: Sua5/YciO/YrdC/YwlC family protein, partial [Thermoplasmata archaeon]|nr:Sua5/YciO/YrdC/YwlC family protein [Thermoplasmata archaeon]
GGAHAVCTVEHSERLRKLYDRPRKPLAVMVRDMEHAERYAVLDKRSRELLSSPRRPIVLVPKKKGEEGKEEWLEDVAPGLDRVGLYLPYTGVQHLLFESLVADAVVMTSANLSGSPMATTNKECLRLPGEVYLLHNRQIVNRTDDSLVLPNKRGFFFLRKSRGYVPSYLPIPHDHSLVAIGGDMNGCGCVASGGRALATQYIGDVGNYDASVFLGKAMTGLMKLSGLSPKDVEGVVVDMHPRYSSRRVGQSLAAQWGVPVLEMQHHAAHLYSLMGEHSKESMVALTCDGTGYGTDDTIWGGEVLSSFSSVSERLARLRPIPMLGGERAVEEPTRLAAAACWLLDMEQPFFKEEEAGVLRKMLGRSVVTSSAGRFLDLVSSWLGICTEMTYDGEPAMRLERYLAKGRQRYKFDVDTRTVNGLLEVDTLDVLRQLADVQPPLAPGAKITEGKKANLAVSTVRPVFEALVDIAASAAEEKGTGEIGFTGGVSYNLVLDRIVEKQLKKHGLRILRHKLVPNGDGGVSYGQAVWAGGRDG